MHTLNLWTVWFLVINNTIQYIWLQIVIGISCHNENYWNMQNISVWFQEMMYSFEEFWNIQTWYTAATSHAEVQQSPGSHHVLANRKLRFCFNHQVNASFAEMPSSASCILNQFELMATTFCLKDEFEVHVLCTFQRHAYE